MMCVFFQVPPPDMKARLAILRIHTRRMPLSKLVNVNDLVKRLKGYTGADIENVCREAALTALRENINATTVVRCVVLGLNLNFAYF